MSRTRVEVETEALAILTGGDVSANPSPEDMDYLDMLYTVLVAELAADGTIYISDPDELADELFMPVSELLANQAKRFGATPDKAAAMQLRNQLRVLSRQTPGYGPQQVEYF